MKTKLLEFIRTKPIFLAFFIPFFVRLVPEVLMGPYVVGFDTLAYYVPNTLNWLNSGITFTSFLSVAPLFYLILMSLTSIGVPIIISLKLLSPLLIGLLGLAVYYYANKTLSWSPNKSLLVVMFATLYFVALRVSWDMLRSELALIFLFVTLAFLQKTGSPRKNLVMLSLAMLSVVFAHQLVAAIMFAIIIATIFGLYLKGQVHQVLETVVCVIPAAVLFVVILFLNSSLAFTGLTAQSYVGFFALFGFSTYSAMIFDTIGFLVFCYLPLIPLLLMSLKKFKGNLQLNIWIVLIILMVSVTLLSQNAFFAVLPYRWILLLIYPLAFFVAQGFSKITQNSVKWGMSLLLISLSIGFIALPNNLAFPYYSFYHNYVPTSMLQNSVSNSESQNVVNAIHWVDNNMPSNGHLLVHDAFLGWASLYLDSDRLLQYGYNNPEMFAMQQNNSSQLYLIWWVNGDGWHGQPTVSSCFKEVYQSGNIVVYNYTDRVFT